MQSPFPFEFDLEIERTFRYRRKKLRVEQQRFKAQVGSSPMAGIGGDKRTLWDFVTLGVQGISSNVEAISFELKPALISMGQQSQFRGTPLEDPNLHLSIFLEACDMLKLNEVSTDVIRLCLFPFSLREKVRTWLHSLPPGCITT